MPDPIVINTGPLITLARIGCLDLVGQIPFQFFCPEAVRDELDEGEALGYPRVAPDWLKVAKLSEPPSTVTLAALDLGEASVIQLALELKVPIVAIDEWKGRRAATASGLQVTGTLGLLGRAKRMGLVSRLRPLIDRATQEGVRYHPDLVRAVLQAVDETDE